MLKIFLLGIEECHSDFTTHFDGWKIEIYDFGRMIGLLIK